MDFFTAMEVSATGLNAERTRINVASSNLANAQTTKTAGGGPYQRRDVVLHAVAPSQTVSGAQAGEPGSGVLGVQVQGIQATRRRRASSTTPTIPTPTPTATSPIPTSTSSRRWST